jgi:hypothetical protein
VHGFNPFQRFLLGAFSVPLLNTALRNSCPKGLDRKLTEYNFIQGLVYKGALALGGNFLEKSY